MTGKELALALAGAAIVGGAAGAAANLALAPKPETAASQPSPELISRLKNAEDALAKTKTALDDSKKAVNELSERVAAAEIKAAKQAADPAAPPGPRNVRIGRHRDAGATAKADEAQTAAGEFNVEGLDDDVAVQIGNALDGIGDQLGAASGDFAALKSGLDLRKLPEADRWQKAKDDLGLTWNQVEELKKAVADRDAAMKTAVTVEKKTNASGGAVTIQRSDTGKAAHAEADYHDRVNATLNDEQKKNWSAKGYDHAFGANPFGGAHGTMVMSVDVSSDKKDAAPKDSAK